jgi:hypothetical protein
MNLWFVGKPLRPEIDRKVRWEGPGSYRISWRVRTYRPILSHALFVRKVQVLEAEEPQYQALTPGLAVLSLVLCSAWFRYLRLGHALSCVLHRWGSRHKRLGCPLSCAFCPQGSGTRGLIILSHVSFILKVRGKKCLIILNSMLI